MDELRIRADGENKTFVPVRQIPLPHLLITATTSGTAQTFTTVRAKAVLRLKTLSVVNITGSAATFYLHSIPSGGSIGDSNAEFKAVSIPANTAADLVDFVGGLYTAGTIIKAYSGTGSALVLHGSAEEIL